MTYCVGMWLDDGLVFMSDTRTNAGVDNIATARKLFTFESTWAAPNSLFDVEFADKKNCIFSFFIFSKFVEQ